MPTTTTQIPQAQLPVLTNSNTFTLPWLRFMQQLVNLIGNGVSPEEIAALQAEITEALSIAEAASASAAAAEADAQEALSNLSQSFLAFSALDEPLAKISLTVPSILTVAGSPIYNVGTLSIGLANENANLVFAGPATGAATVPTFRVLTLASADFVNQGTATQVLHGNAAGNPSWSAINLTSDVSGTLPVVRGGTGQTTYTNGELLIGNTTTGGLTLSTLTAGSNITIANSPGAITISASGGSGSSTSGTPLIQGAVGTISTSAFAFKGITFEPNSTIQISAIWLLNTVLVLGGTYAGAIAPINSLIGTPTTAANATFTNSYVDTTGASPSVRIEFSTPVTLTSGIPYVVLIGRTDSTGTYALPLNTPTLATFNALTLGKTGTIARCASTTLPLGTSVDTNSGSTEPPYFAFEVIF